MTKWILVLFSVAGLWAASTDPAAEKEVRAAMETWRQAVLHKDAAALGRLLHDDLLYGHSTDRVETKAQAIEAIVHGTETIEGIDLSDMNVLIYGTTALVRCKGEFHVDRAGQHVTVPLDILHVWLKSSGSWQMVARQAVRRPE